MYNNLHEIEVLTGVPESTINKVLTKGQVAISQNAFNAGLDGEDCIEVNIGYGVLRIKRYDDEIKYKFFPSKYLENAVRSAFVDGVSTLEAEMELSIRDKVENAYSEFKGMKELF